MEYFLDLFLHVPPSLPNGGLSEQQDDGDDNDDDAEDRPSPKSRGSAPPHLTPKSKFHGEDTVISINKQNWEGASTKPRKRTKTLHL